MENRLGISLGTRLIGIAVRYNGELSEYRIRTFYGKWTPEKEDSILTTIHRLIIRNEITVVIMKAPEPVHSSPNLLQLMGSIERVAKRCEIRLVLCSINDLKASYRLFKNNNKDDLAKAVLERHLWDKELVRLYVKMQKKSNAYYLKLFEAIACTEPA